MRLEDLFTVYQPTGNARKARAETMLGQRDNGVPTDGSTAAAGPVVTKTPITAIKEGKIVTITAGPYSFEVMEPPSFRFIA